MDAGFEGECCQQLILLSGTFMHQLITRLLISILQSLDPFIFFKTGKQFLIIYGFVNGCLKTKVTSLFAIIFLMKTIGQKRKKQYLRWERGE